jgi:hypothetical protein
MTRSKKPPAAPKKSPARKSSEASIYASPNHFRKRMAFNPPPDINKCG